MSLRIGDTPMPVLVELFKTRQRLTYRVFRHRSDANGATGASATCALLHWERRSVPASHDYHHPHATSLAMSWSCAVTSCARPCAWSWPPRVPRRLSSPARARSTPASVPRTAVPDPPARDCPPLVREWRQTLHEAFLAFARVLNSEALTV